MFAEPLPRGGDLGDQPAARAAGRDRGPQHHPRKGPRRPSATTTVSRVRYPASDTAARSRTQPQPANGSHQSCTLPGSGLLLRRAGGRQPGPTAPRLRPPTPPDASFQRVRHRGALPLRSPGACRGPYPAKPRPAAEQPQPHRTARPAPHRRRYKSSGLCGSTKQASMSVSNG